MIWVLILFSPEEFTDIGAKIDLVMNTLDDMEKNSNHLMEQAKQLLDEFRSQD